MPEKDPQRNPEHGLDIMQLAHPPRSKCGSAVRRQRAGYALVGRDGGHEEGLGVLIDGCRCHQILTQDDFDSNVVRGALVS